MDQSTSGRCPNCDAPALAGVDARSVCLHCGHRRPAAPAELPPPPRPTPQDQHPDESGPDDLSTRVIRDTDHLRAVLSGPPVTGSPLPEASIHPLSPEAEHRPVRRPPWPKDQASAQDGPAGPGGGMRAGALYYPVSDVRIVGGQGVFAVDADGRAYVDCAAGTFNLSLGYQHPAVVRAVQRQAGQLIHVTSSFQAEPVMALAERLVALAPAGLTRAHLKVTGGSTANEGAIKMAQLATGRRDVVTLFRSHHGQTSATTVLSGNAFRRASLPFAPAPGLQAPDPYCLRCFYGQERASCGLMCVDRIGDLLEFAGSGNVAAVLVEPISGNGGNIVPPEGYFTRLRELCDAHGLKLLVDEVQTGIGRTGRMFASEHFGITPDAMTLGKGLGGSGVPVAAILASEELAGLPISDHAFTGGANLLGAAAALATLEVVADPAFLANVRATGARILARLRDLQARHRCIGDVRGVGLMIGVELVTDAGDPAPELANRLAAEAMGHGLILRTSRYGRGNVIKVRPPLVLSMSEADLLCDRMDALLGARR